MTPKPYNFQKPGPLASALEHQFASWLKTVCALATRQWRKQLPGNIEVQFARSDFERACDALAGIADGAVGFRVTLHERLPTLVVWPRPVMLGIVAALQGAAGTELPADRELTLIEDALFEFFLKDLLLPPFVETWSGRLPIHPVIGIREINPRWSRLFGSDESLVVTRFRLKTPFGDHDWTWLLPKKGLLESLWRETETAEAAAAVRQRLETSVRDLPVDVTVTLGSVELQLSQLAQLNVGDVIVLDQRIHQPLQVSIADQTKLCGWPGRHGNRQVLQIADWE